MTRGAQSEAAAVGSICTIAPTSTANLSTSVPLPALPIAANSSAGLLVDVSLDNLLSATLGADFKNGVDGLRHLRLRAPARRWSEPKTLWAKLHRSTQRTIHFLFRMRHESFSLAVDSSTTFFQFPSSACTTSGFACLSANQILSVDIGIRADGTPVARNILFEDADSSDAEVEGMITGTNVGQQQFSIVMLAVSAPGTGLTIGNTATVHYSISPATPFDVDFTHADNVAVDTTCCAFGAPINMAVGQQVSVRRNSSSSGTSIVADRVRLRSSRITASVQSIGSPNIYLYNLASIFSGNGVTQIQAQTSAQTILSENNIAIPFTQIPVSGLVSVRGPLFNVGNGRTLVATKVVLKP